MRQINQNAQHKESSFSVAKTRTRQSDLHLIKEDIAAGNYNVSSDDIAEKMLSTHRFLFRHHR